MQFSFAITYTYKLLLQANTNEYSNSSFCQITLVIVVIYDNYVNTKIGLKYFIIVLYYFLDN